MVDKRVKKVNERVVLLSVFILLAVFALGILFVTNPKLTGYVVGPEGQECDGDWECGNWGECINETQTRDCESTNSTNCVSPIMESQSCTIECIENWNCSEWSDCVNETQTRICTDANNCETTDDKPEESQECEDINVTTFCGDGIVQEPNSEGINEKCDDGENYNGQECSPVYGSLCEWCSSDCLTLTTIQGAYCGDDTCNSEENCDSCSNDCGECQEDEEESETSEETTSTESTIGESSIITGASTENVCTSNWQCNDWSECLEGIQVRECSDLNECGSEEGKPSLSQQCEVIIEETCFDEIKNQDEEGIDCGGLCEEKCSVFTIVGNVISGPIESGKEFFQKNKIIILIILGVIVLALAGFLTFGVLKKKKILPNIKVLFQKVLEKSKETPKETS